MEDARPVTSREIQAVVFNMKEERVLAKRIHTLGLEENYSMKLIGLGNRQVKIGHKRMQSKVSKIRSHLSVEEITDLKTAEMEGRFIPRSITPITPRLSARPTSVVNYRSQSARVPNHTTHQSTHAPGQVRTLSARVPEATPLHSADVPNTDNQSALVLSSSGSPAIPAMQTEHAAPNELRNVHMNPLKLVNGNSNHQSSKLPCLPSPVNHSRAHTSPPSELSKVNGSPRQNGFSSDLEAQDRQVTTSKTETKVQRQSTRAPTTIRFAEPQSAHALSSKHETEMKNGLQAPKASPRSPDMASGRKLNGVASDSAKIQLKQSAGSPKISSRMNNHLNVNHASSNGHNNSFESDTSAKDHHPHTSPLGAPMNPPLLNRPKTAPGHSTFCYSSHEIPRKRTALQNSSQNSQTPQPPGPARPTLERRGSLASITSIGSDIARNKAAERRQDLLEEEQFTQAELENKRQDFLQRITTWMKENPAVTIKPKPVEPEASDNPKKNQVMLRSRHRVLTAEEIQQQTDKAWRDLAKCRYLRIDEADMDLSGVNTLVRDQLALFRTFKIGNQPSNLPAMRKQSSAQFALRQKEMESEVHVDSARSNGT